MARRAIKASAEEKQRMKSTATPTGRRKLPTFLLVALLAVSLGALMPGRAALASQSQSDPLAIAAQRISLPTAPSANSLTQFKAVVGQVVLSEDACGTNGPSCNVDIVKPSASATVRESDLFCATTGFSNYRPANGDVTLNGNPVTWAQIISNGIQSFNARVDVTTIVKPVGDAALPGLVSFKIAENPTLNYDGCILKVIWDDPTTTQNSILVYFGAQSTTGDTFVINFAQPLNAAAFAAPLEFSLGISFSFQSAVFRTNQFSTVDVNSLRMTSCAGGQDDGAGANGALITVGGTRDTPTNPLPNCTDAAGPRSDDELYDLRPFVMLGDTSMTIFTKNPSNDDNIFLANVFLRNVTVVVTEPPIAAQGITFSATEGVTYNGPVATFTDSDPKSTAAEYSATIDWGDGSPTTAGVPNGPMGGPFTVNGTHTYAEDGTYKVTVVITDIDTPSNNATANSTARVADAALTARCATPPFSTQTYNGPTAVFTDQSSTGTLSDFTATINWGDSSTSAGTIVGGPGNVPYTVSGSHPYSSTGTFTITTKINDIGGSSATVSCTVTIFAFATAKGAAFVIGDLEAGLGNHVTWWSSQWANINLMSKGAPPDAMKGFAGFEDNFLGLPPPNCGGTWSTDPGNSTPPPPTVPKVMGVIVSSQVTKSGSIITGDIKQVVIVDNDPGYAPSPGHPGTGTEIGILCAIP
jgi:hypothetical protein